MILSCFRLHGLIKIVPFCFPSIDSLEKVPCQCYKSIYNQNSHKEKGIETLIGTNLLCDYNLFNEFLPKLGSISVPQSHSSD